MKLNVGCGRERPKRFEVMNSLDGESVFIDDDDFGWDALLRVQGDFGDIEAARKFAQAVCDVLNENEARIPIRAADQATGEP